MIRIYILLAAIALSLAAGWVVNGWRLEGKYADLERDYKQAVLDAKDAQEKHDVQRQLRLDEAERASAAVSAALAVSSRVIEKEVVRYVVDPEVGDCALDAEWVQLHNRAATGTKAVTSSSVEFDATTRTALPVITDNYLTCRNISAQLIGLQAWVKELVTNN